jgi:hypothetical protein
MSGPPEEGAVGGLKSLKKLAHRWSVGMSQFEEGVRDATSKEPYVGSTSNECLSCIRKSGFRRLQTRRPGQSAPRYNETVEQIVVSLDPRELVSMGPCPPIISISRNDADTVIFVMEERCKDPELIVPGADAPKYWKTLKVQIVFPFLFPAGRFLLKKMQRIRWCISALRTMPSPHDLLPSHSAAIGTAPIGAVLEFL